MRKTGFYYDLFNLSSLINRLEGTSTIFLREEDIYHFNKVCDVLSMTLDDIDRETLNQELLQLREEFKRASNGTQEKEIIYKIYNHRRK